MPDQLSNTEKSLNADALINETVEYTGLTDFGGQDFEQRFRRLLSQVARGVRFTDMGLANYRGSVNRLLVNRLRMQEDIKRHPEILAQKIVKPIIILGMPRTGTTKLQRMISASPDVQKLTVWRLFNPAPFPNAVAGRPDPRITAMTGGEMLIDEFSQNEAMNAAHKMGLTDAEEETILLEYVFNPSILGFSPYYPLFFHDEWLKGTEERAADYDTYSYVRTMLQYLQWQDNGGAPDRPLIMKSPGHSAHLKALYKTYPDATFVQSHRDPGTVVPSVCKYLTSIWEQSCEIDKKAIGQQIHDWLRLGMKRLIETRDQLGLDDRFIDVSYTDVRSNIMPVIEKIFARNGRELTAEARTAMLQWEQTNEEGKHGKNIYSLEEFGLDEARIKADFAEYTERFSDYL